MAAKGLNNVQSLRQRRRYAALAITPPKSLNTGLPSSLLWVRPPRWRPLWQHMCSYHRPSCGIVATPTLSSTLWTSDRTLVSCFRCAPSCKSVEARNEQLRNIFTDAGTPLAEADPSSPPRLNLVQASLRRLVCLCTLSVMLLRCVLSSFLPAYRASLHAGASLMVAHLAAEPLSRRGVIEGDVQHRTKDVCCLCV